ncbi:unnamed protein product [Linum trigynum]|uniref:Peroxidase n=1 Tax=Linum trigynum TaxID=586398 RepID=A0AAV2D894_9ROSI
MAAVALRALLVCFAAALFMAAAQAQLSPNFYQKTCPKALPAIKKIVKEAIKKEARMGASLLRLHFHDCFVNGCDGSILLDDTKNFTGEKTAPPNLNSARGFDVVDKIKTAVNKACKANIVSCADILAVAARDSVAILGGSKHYYPVMLGRRDARTTTQSAATNNLPPPFFNFSQLLSNFQSHGLNVTDLVALSGGHTIGLARCANIVARIVNDTNIPTTFAASLRRACPPAAANGPAGNATQPLDRTPASFDTQYYGALIGSRGLLHSDQQLFGRTANAASNGLVRLYSGNPAKFAADFAASMVKMGNMKPLTGKQGEIRKNCRRPN